MLLEDACTVSLPRAALAPAVRAKVVPQDRELPVSREQHRWTATGLERQVFVDDSGRRQRHVRRAGFALAGLASIWLAALVTGGIGFSSLPSAQQSVAALAAARPAHVAVQLPRHRAIQLADVDSLASPTGSGARRRVGE